MKKDDIFNYKQMQELLPDYIFNRISEKDKFKFEKELPKYTDLQDEIKEVKSIFAKLDKMDLDKTLAHYSRNTSVKVNNRLASKKQKMPFFNNTLKYLIPTAALFFIGYLVFFNFNKPNSEVIQIDKQPKISFLSEKDTTALFDSSLTNEDYLELSLTYSTNHHSNDAIEYAIEDIASNEFFNDIILTHILSNNEEIKDIDYNHTYYYEFINNLNEINESTFQELLKELEDVKITS